MAKLKVFRTPIGFQDAYVAAPSRKAALAAWGSDVDLFARGVAEIVEDEGLTAEPLSRPGEIIRRSRGTAAQHLRALAAQASPSRRVTADASPRPRSGSTRTEKASRPGKRPTPRPKPSRDDLERAEKALADAAREQTARLDEIKARRRSLDREERTIRAEHDERLERLERARDKARQRFTEKLEAWAVSEAKRHAP